MAVFSGSDQLLWVDFEPNSSPIDYIRQTLKAARHRSPIPFFGAAVGVVVNFDPDCGVRFDMQGLPIEILPAAHRGGELSVSIGGGPPVSSKTIAAILSGQ
jgi:hypothetical protein